MTANEVRKLLQKRQGKETQVAYAKRIGISPAYLSDIYAGKRDPAKKVLDYLGLKRETIYCSPLR